MASSSSSGLYLSRKSKCLICFTSFQSDRSENPEHFTKVFQAFCRLMQIELMEPLSWDFEKDCIPFCSFCVSAVEKLKGLYDQLENLQQQITSLLQTTKLNILRSGSTSKTTEHSVLERVSYFRQLVIKGCARREDNIHTEDLDLSIKVEIESEEPRVNLSFLDQIVDPCVFENHEDESDPLDEENTMSFGENCVVNANISSAHEHMSCDSDLLFLDSEHPDSSVHKPGASLSSDCELKIIQADNSDGYKCNVCQKTFRRKATLQFHSRDCHADEEFNCECGETFTTNANLLLHRKQIHQSNSTENSIVTNHSCDSCDKTFATLKSLQSHKCIHATDGDGRHYNQFVANEEQFPDQFKVIPHKKTHRVKGNKCPYCGKLLSNSAGLNRHMKIHTGEKPYSCEFCQRSFSQSNHLRIHERIHTGERPYECNVCDMKFIRSDALARHRRTH